MWAWEADQYLSLTQYSTGGTKASGIFIRLGDGRRGIEQIVRVPKEGSSGGWGSFYDDAGDLAHTSVIFLKALQTRKYQRSQSRSSKMRSRRRGFSGQ